MERWKTTLVGCLLVNLYLSTECARILAQPFVQGLNSRLLNMERLIGFLVAHGHHVTMITHNEYDANRVPKDVEFISHPLPKAMKLTTDQDAVAEMMATNPSRIAAVFLESYAKYCESLLACNDAWTKIKTTSFDLYIYDVAESCARFVQKQLSAPSIAYANDGFGVHMGIFYPVPLSFVPAPYSTLDPDMNFLQRLYNVFFYVLSSYVAHYTLFYPNFKDLPAKYNIKDDMGPHEPVCDLLFVNTDWSFQSIRPTMPHVVLIGGIFFREADPLPSKFQEFMESGRDTGIVIVAFGTLLTQMEPERAEIFARVFAKLPQRVVWRYKGATPKAIGSNTRIYPWLPQNDLLGHPNAKLFVTHCGISSSHEAINHAIPVIAVPLFFDQFDHARKLVSQWKVGIKVDFYKNFNDASFESAIRAIFDNYTYYKNNALRLSKLMKDQPMHPKEKFLFWIDHVLRHNGTKHLASKALELPWYQYFLVDVILFVTLVICIITGFTYFICRTTFGCLCARRQTKHLKEN